MLPTLNEEKPLFMSYTYISIERMDRRGLRDASTVRSTCWLYEMTQVQFLHSHCGLQQAVTPGLEDPTPSSDFMVIRHTHDKQAYMQAEHSCMLIFNLKTYYYYLFIS